MPEESPVLRIHQTPGGDGRHRVEVRFREPGGPEQSAHATVALPFSEQDRRDLRWYLEDYLQHPFDPAPAIAARVETRIEEVGGGANLRPSPPSARCLCGGRCAAHPLSGGRGVLAR